MVTGKLPNVLDEAVIAAKKPPHQKDADQLLAEAARPVADVKLYKERLAKLQAIRRPVEPIWRDIKDYLLPESGRHLGASNDDADSDADRPDFSQILDSSPRSALTTAANGLHGGLTSPSTQWFSYYVGDYDQYEESVSEEARDWIYSSQIAVRDVLAGSNFYAAIQKFYAEELSAGVAVILATKDHQTVARYLTLEFGSYWLGQGDDLRVNTLYRRYSSTAKDIVEKYGRDNCPRQVIEALEQRKPDRRFSIIQAIQPWNFFGNGKPHPRFQYEDVRFVEKSTDDDPALYRGGYVTKPFVATRWSDPGDAIYPKSCPGINSLPDNKQLQLAALHYNCASEWLINPAWAVPSELKEKAGAGIMPGAMVSVSGDPRGNQFYPIIPPTFDFSQNIAQRQDLRQLIQDAFFNRFFVMVQSRERQMTATEVAELIQEKNNLLGPVVVQNTSEGLTPLLDRTFEIVADSGLLPPAPPEIAGQEIKPYFTSALAIAQRQAANAGSDRALMWLNSAMQVNPEVADGANFDAWWRSKAEDGEVPADVVRSEEEIQELRAARQQAMAQQQQMAGMQQAAATAKTLSDTSMDEGTALSAVANGMGSGMEGGI